MAQGLRIPVGNGQNAVQNNPQKVVLAGPLLRHIAGDMHGTMGRQSRT